MFVRYTVREAGNISAGGSIWQVDLVEKKTAFMFEIQFLIQKKLQDYAVFINLKVILLALFTPTVSICSLAASF